MSLSVKILNCNGECADCYERAVWDRGGQPPYNLGAILTRLYEQIAADKARVKKGARRCSRPVVHGGEPLMLPPGDLKQILEVIYGYWGETGIQTNGLLLNDEHLELFDVFKTHIGVSLDGDTWGMNTGRWNLRQRDPNFIQAKTDLVWRNMERSKRAGLRMSVITVLRRMNGLPDDTAELKRFVLRLESELGITDGRMNPGIVFDAARRATEELTEAELAATYREMADFIYGHPTLMWHPFRDVVDLVLGSKEQTCIWNDCDPFHTRAERTICWDGSIGNCLKPAQSRDGIQVLSADEYKPGRARLLSAIPQVDGGCQGCRWVRVCHGGCPGEGIDNDWRNRTRFCGGYRTLYEEAERRIRGLFPSLHLAADFPVEAGMDECLYALRKAPRPSTYAKSSQRPIESLVKEMAARPAQSVRKQGHGDSPHGDSNDPAWRAAHPEWKAGR